MSTYKGLTVTDLVLVLRLVDAYQSSVAGGWRMPAWTLVQQALKGCVDMDHVQRELMRRTSSTYACAVQLDSPVGFTDVRKMKGISDV